MKPPQLRWWGPRVKQKFSGFGHERIKAPERQRLIADVKPGLIDNLIVFCQKQLKGSVPHFKYKFERHIWRSKQALTLTLGAGRLGARFLNDATHIANS